MWHKDNLLRDGSSNLTATETGSGGQIQDLGKGGTGPQGLAVVINVPSVSGTSPTLDLAIDLSDDNTFATGVEKVTFARITAKSQYTRRVISRKQYARHVATVGGTSPNFGAAVIGIVSGNHDGNFNPFGN